MADFDAVEARLRSILDSYRDRLVVKPDGLYLPGIDDKPHGYVAGVRRGKQYVSFYLMPAYAFPDFTDSISPALRARKQGKSCFNFSKVDDALFAELTDLTRRGIDRYEKAVAAGDGWFADESRFGPARAAAAAR